MGWFIIVIVKFVSKAGTRTIRATRFQRVGTGGDISRREYAEQRKAEGIKVSEEELASIKAEEEAKAKRAASKIVQKSLFLKQRYSSIATEQARLGRPLSHDEQLALIRGELKTQPDIPETKYKFITGAGVFKPAEARAYQKVAEGVPVVKYGGMEIITTKPKLPPRVEPLTAYEERAERLFARQERFEKGIERVRELAGFITFARDKPYEERGFFGKYIQDVATAIVGVAPLAFAGIPLAAGKAAYISESLIRPETRLMAIQEAKAGVKRLKDVYDIRTPSGLATWTLALGLPLPRAIAKYRAAKLPIKYKQISKGEMVGIKRPFGVTDVLIKPVDFAAQIGKIKVVGVGEGIGRIAPTKIPKVVKIGAEYKFDVFVKPKPRVKLPIKTEARLLSLAKLGEKAFKGFGAYRTVTMFGKKPLIDYRVLGFKGLEFMGGDFPRYLVRTGEVMPFGKAIEPTIAKVGVVRKVAEIKKDMIFRKEVKYTPEEYAKLLVKRGELGKIKEVELPYPTLARYRFPLPKGKPFKPYIEIRKGFPPAIREPVIRHELIHHLYPKLPESKVLKEMFKFKKFKEIELVKEPTIIEYYDFLEKGVSAKWIKRFERDFGYKPMKKIKIGKKAQIQLFKPEVTKEIPKVDVKPIFSEAFMKAQERAIRKAYEITTIPRVRQIGIPITKAKVMQRIEALQRTRAKQRLESMSRLQSMMRLETLPKVAVMPKVTTIQRIRAMQRLGLISRLGAVSRITPIIIPMLPKMVIPPPPIFPLPFPQLFKPPKKKKKIRKRLFEYKPSLIPLEEKIFGKKPKFLTGLKIRPISF